MSALFAGTTDECLKHLERATKKDYLGARKIIADFCGVGESTVYRWLKGGAKPVGEPLIRLRFYLEFLGYDVAELRSLAPEVRDAARLCGFSIASISEVAQLVGYAGGRAGVDVLLTVFRGTAGASKEKLEEFKSFSKAYGEPFASKQKSTKKVQMLGVALPRAEHVPEVSPKAVAAAQSILRPKPVSDRESVIESLAGSVRAMIPLARLISSDEFSAEERARVRELSGTTHVFDLANLLYNLCGERARNMQSSS